ncbi:MAG: hypothetical protein A2Z99_12695 [Treponema sp. GWB1_62_6]|nr:MAG: hypothetical protein A2001_05625 [Treponema sp. GWC1_61_84]OHE68429.1 MAG: hypothetical protein A2413_06490 [Treponema sp. RIFOXYC1_FULL_61_9]OHE70450.1 MAG: hypothetical protein A2Z99_12695 [Treponema sp. GWB1_62_6]HCM27233.1 hypothetical protein [Treponema sp.]
MKRGGSSFAAMLFLFFAMGGTVPCIDFAVRFDPELAIPLDGGSKGDFSLGGGGTLTADAVFSGAFSPYIEVGLHLAPLRGTSDALSLYNGGAGVSYAVFPIPRLKLRAGVSGGLFQAVLGEDSRNDLYWKTRLEAGYRFTPSFGLLALADYSSYANSPTPGQPLYHGISLGFVVDFGIGSTAGRASGVYAETFQRGNVFPIRYYAYDKESFGGIRIVNKESAEIRDVVVSFAMLGENASETVCATFKSIQRGDTAEAPLLAVVGDRCLEFTEGTKVEGSVKLTFRILDEKIERSFPASISFNHRNASTWADPRIAAAFVSPNDVAVLDLSKYAAGLVRERIRPEIDHALQYGIGVFETMRLTGIVWTVDPSAPYAECRADSARVDYIQYPFQTFAYKGGDSDDVAILLAASMESVGLTSALIPLEQGMLVAFALDAPDEEARKAFTDHRSFAWMDGKAWVVLDPKLVREGFLSSWKRGAEEWNAAAGKDGESLFYSLKDAWKEYPPVGVTEADRSVPKPKESLVANAFENAMGNFVAMEVEPRAKRMVADMGPNGGTARQINSLGILYARYGLLDDARREFTRAIEKGSSSALINLANTVFLLADYETAATMYAKALAVDPQNKAALLGLARSKYELDAYEDADDLFSRVDRLDHDFASRYAYLSSNVASGASRAAAAETGGPLPWATEE